jgi:hypothetical protein
VRRQPAEGLTAGQDDAIFRYCSVERVFVLVFGSNAGVDP